MAWSGWTLQMPAIPVISNLAMILTRDIVCPMRIISHSTLKTFWSQPKYVDAREPLEAWFHFTKVADWVTPVDVKADFRSASILMDGRVIFDIAGNKYRLVVWINYTFRTVYIRFVSTHEQYDNINPQTI
jgi:mRNA interferase HigB